MPGADAKPHLQGTDRAEILVVVERLKLCEIGGPKGFSEAVGRHASTPARCAGALVKPVSGLSPTFFQTRFRVALSCSRYLHPLKFLLILFYSCAYSFSRVLVKFLR